ncbi:MAG: BPL-N domain-containing protein [Acidobacteriota bacterium]|nr:BPL-N domain-containing protein [Acidobacteriota bacterium]
MGEGLATLVTEESWAAGWRDTTRRTVFVGPGAAFFSGGDGEILARWSTGRSSDPEEQQPALLRFFYGAGRGVLSGPLPAVDVRSEGDWSVRDDRRLSSADAEHDQGLLLSLVEWTATGADRRPAHRLPAANPGRRIALYTTRSAAGGAFPALLTALARALEAAGAAPLAIGSREVWWAALDPEAFDLLVMPGGWAAGYVSQLSGVEAEIRDFVAAGGGYMGISAGAFYAADTVLWSGQSYDYPLDVFLGSLEGPLDEIAPWPEHALTPLRMDDPEIGVGTWKYLVPGGRVLPSAALPAAGGGGKRLVRRTGPAPGHPRHRAPRFRRGPRDLSQPAPGGGRGQ